MKEADVLIAYVERKRQVGTIFRNFLFFANFEKPVVVISDSPSPFFFGVQGITYIQTFNKFFRGGAPELQRMINKHERETRLGRK